MAQHNHQEFVNVMTAVACAGKSAAAPFSADQEYQGRTRDPPRVNPAEAPDSEPETEPEVD